MSRKVIAVLVILIVVSLYAHLGLGVLQSRTEESGSRFQDASVLSMEPVESPAPPETVEETESPPMSESETMQETGIFPGALSIGEYFSYRHGKFIALEMTVTGYLFKRGYEWHNPAEGSQIYTTTLPKENNQFAFVFFRLANQGLVNYWSPSSNQFILWSNNTAFRASNISRPEIGDERPVVIIARDNISHFSTLSTCNCTDVYNCTADCSKNVPRVMHVKDLIDTPDWDFVTGRYNESPYSPYATQGETNAKEGYLVFEVPLDTEPEETYLILQLNNETQAVWRLKR